MWLCSTLACVCEPVLCLFVFVNHGRQVSQPQPAQTQGVSVSGLRPGCLPSPGTKASKVGMRRMTFQAGQQSAMMDDKTLSLPALREVTPA